MAAKLSYWVVEVNALLALAAFTGYLFYFHSQAPWFTRSIICDDPAYSKSYVSKEEQFIPDLAVYIAVSAAIPVMIFALQMLYAGCAVYSSTNDSEKKKRIICKSIEKGFYILGLYFSGLLVLLIFIKFSQLLGGSPAPYFLTLCGMNCTEDSNTVGSSSLTTDQWFITPRNCNTQFNNKITSETLSSFPCLLSSSSVYATTYLTIFCVILRRRHNLRLLPPTIVTVAICGMFLVTTYRVREFRGHITDVAAGGILGVIAAIVQTDWKYVQKPSGGE